MNASDVANKNMRGGLVFAAFQLFAHEIPIHQLVKERFDEFGTSIAIVHIVSMFPNVQRQQRLETFGQGSTRIAGVNDI